jgi:heme/copper-type cytochrome/quinol oxidase subunit 3
MQRDLAEQRLSRRELQDLRNKRTGLAIFQFSWILVFVCLAIVNLQLRGASPSWPPPGVEKLSPVLPTIATLGLLASVFFTRRAVQALERSDTPGFVLNWRWVLALGAAFVVMMAFEFLSIPTSGTYSDVFRMMTGFHIIHALVIGGFMLRILNGARAGVYHTENAWPVEGAASLWYFVVVAWMIFYVVLYWI